MFSALEGFSDARTGYWSSRKNSVRFMFYDAYYYCQLMQISDPPYNSLREELIPEVSPKMEWLAKYLGLHCDNL